MHRDLFSGDKDELALTLLDIVEPLQYPLSVLQKARRHALASPLLIDGAGNWEMPPLESADQHPAPSQKLPTSKQLTPPAAPASAPLLPSASIVPIPLSLNLLHDWSVNVSNRALLCVRVYMCVYVLEIIIDLPFGYPINNIMALCVYVCMRARVRETISCTHVYTPNTL